MSEDLSDRSLWKRGIETDHTPSVIFGSFAKIVFGTLHSSFCTRTFASRFVDVVRWLSPENIEIRVDPAFGVGDPLLQRDAILPAELGAGEGGVEQVGGVFAGTVGHDFGEVFEFHAGLVAHERDEVADGDGPLGGKMKHVARFPM